VIQLYQELQAIEKNGDDTCKEFMTKLHNQSRQLEATSFQNIARLFNDWVREQLGADLVYLLLYDGRHDMFRVMGITISDELFDRWLKHKHELTDFMGPHLDLIKIEERKTLNETLRSALPKPDGSNQGDSLHKSLRHVLHGLLEHSIISRFRPRHPTQRARGMSWEVLNGTAGTPFRYEDLRRFDRATQYYLQTLYARPFATDHNSLPEGVTWIGWRDRSAARDIQNDNQLSDAALENRVHLVEQVAAAIFALYRYYNPDDALNPLPFRDNR
jgi:hypothetical protein